MKGTPASADATVSNGTPASLSVLPAGGRARALQLLLDGAGLVVGEAPLALLQGGDRGLRIAGHAQCPRVLVQRVRARHVARALAQLDGLLRERQRLVGPARSVEVEGLQLQLGGVVAGAAGVALAARLRLLPRL